jgi:hypothetical protein
MLADTSPEWATNLDAVSEADERFSRRIERFAFRPSNIPCVSRSVEPREAMIFERVSVTADFSESRPLRNYRLTMGMGGQHPLLRMWQLWGGNAAAIPTRL